jgi:hypothetical protein
MVTELAPIKADFLDASSLGPLGDRTTDRLGGLLVATEPDGIADLLVDRTSRRQRPPRDVVDDLGVNMLVRAEHSQTGPLRGAADVPADTETAADPLPENRAGVVHGSVTAGGCGERKPKGKTYPVDRLLRNRFAGLATHLLALVADPLALVGLGLPTRTNFGCELTNKMFINALNDDVRLIGAGDRQASGNR